MSKDSMRYEASQIMKDKHRECANCGSEENIHIHHIVPLSQGGGNRESNLVFLCAECHKKAHAYVNNRVKVYEDMPNSKKPRKKSVMEQIHELKDMAKRFKIDRPFLFETFKDYVGKLSANDPSVLDENDIATMQTLMMYRELGMSQKQFMEMFINAGEEVAKEG